MKDFLKNTPHLDSPAKAEREKYTFVGQRIAPI
jgi:hypothetical protein